ncbi:MAG: response regulator [Gammaproteobacteria bacterium]|nr:response regulator [Gammaproteobacteria bacterium]MDH3987418.1 response regulator [Gammaproteobacteria bacterium]
MSRYADFRILIVDDNRNNLFTLRALIRKHMDAEVLEADSGQAALDMALNNPRIDLIVLDIQMPEMDGFQTASMLKVRHRTRDIPIIFLTAAYKTDEFQQRGYDVGAADYLLKPIDDNQLINKISTYLRLIEKERDMNRRLEQRVEERTRELNAAKQYLESVISHMGEALLLLDPEGRIKTANPAACSMLDYREADLQGMAIGDVFEEEEKLQANAFMGVWLEALIRTGTISSIEASFIAKDQRRVPILFSRTAITDDAGEISDIICIAKDMSGYRRDAG